MRLSHQRTTNPMTLYSLLCVCGCGHKEATMASTEGDKHWFRFPWSLKIFWKTLTVGAIVGRTWRTLSVTEVVLRCLKSPSGLAPPCPGSRVLNKLLPIYSDEGRTWLIYLCISTDPSGSTALYFGSVCPDPSSPFERYRKFTCPFKRPPVSQNSWRLSNTDYNYPV